jgi:16S rRNA (cytidine1402-2'-O)-methyltransferase
MNEGVENGTDNPNPNGRLSVVATPIGNMGDITFRALWNLKEADVIYAEDTRVISKLLAHYGLRTSLQRLDAATEGKKGKEIAERLHAGEHVALVTDAGTPGISDPGSRLVAYIREHAPEAIIDAIPGPSALTAALSIAGVDATQFTFIGFLPHKKGRQTAIQALSKSKIPVVLYESPHRIVKFLTELAKVAPKARVSIGRELTKMHEELIQGTAKELAAHIEKKKTARGEFVVIVEP